MLVARVLVTPTRVVALAPEVELSNRVWRAYRCDCCLCFCWLQHE
jgi:hypothetical protein